jgi:hypothetical protein
MTALPLCAKVGVLHGLIIGFLFAVWRLSGGFPGLALQELIWAMILLALIAIGCSLFILIVVERYRLSSVVWATLVNGLLVSALTLLILVRLTPHQYFLLLCLWLSALIGLFIGWLLCRICIDRLVAAKG